MRTEHPSYPSFTDAVERLREFLDRHQWPVDIRWLRPGTVSIRNQAVILNAVAFQPAEEVRTAYWHAVPKQRGVLLAGLCHDTKHSFCHLWAPSDEDEADDHLMPDGVKLSVPVDPPDVLIASGWRLRWHRWRSRDVPLEGLMMTYPSSPELQQIHR